MRKNKFFSEKEKKILIKKSIVKIDKIRKLISIS